MPFMVSLHPTGVLLDPGLAASPSPVFPRLAASRAPSEQQALQLGQQGAAAGSSRPGCWLCRGMQDMIGTAAADTQQVAKGSQVHPAQTAAGTPGCTTVQCTAAAAVGKPEVVQQGTPV